MRTENLDPPAQFCFFFFLSFFFFFSILWELTLSSSNNAKVRDIPITGLSDGSNILNLVFLWLKSVTCKNESIARMEKGGELLH